MTAEWKPGFAWLYKANPQIIAEEISSIGESVTPMQILEKARDTHTELHKCFEWDDTAAAEKYRLQQARKIVCHLVIRETIQDSNPPIRFFYKTDASSAYQPTQKIIRNQDSYQALLASAMRDLVALKAKYHSLAELESIFDAVDELLKAG